MDPSGQFPSLAGMYMAAANSPVPKAAAHVHFSAKDVPLLIEGLHFPPSSSSSSAASPSTAPPPSLTPISGLPPSRGAVTSTFPEFR